MTMQYFGIKRNTASAPHDASNANPFNDDPMDDVGCLLGSKIIECFVDGADLGVQVTPSYDEEVMDDSTNHDVDLLSSPNHDFFDIAETGHLVEAMPSQPVETKED